MSQLEVLRLASCGAIGAPLLATAILGLLLFTGQRRSERLVSGIAQGALLASFAASLVCVLIALGPEWTPRRMPLVEWFRVGDMAYELALLSDRLTLVMMPLVSGLTLLATHFSRDYLHRDPGFLRFHFLVGLFATGMLWVVASASLEQLFVGWELVGVSSALLVGYFQERRAPSQAGARVFTTYRLCDLGILLAVPALHHAVGSAEFVLSGEGASVHRLSAVGGVTGLAIALALLLGAIGKSAQLPAGGWLPRAMEGPTPSSALFYGGVSVHAGVFLLLRAGTLLEASPLARLLVGLCGLTTAVYAGLAARVQSDAKGTLAFATMAQVGVMFVEIAAGLETLALVHLVSHAVLRIYQLFRAPSALSDARAIEAALANVGPQSAPLASPARHRGAPRYLYRIALDRTFLDTVQNNWLLQPVFSAARWFEAWERRWLGRIEGAAAPLVFRGDQEGEGSALARPASGREALQPLGADSVRAEVLRTEVLRAEPLSTEALSAESLPVESLRVPGSHR